MKRKFTLSAGYLLFLSLSIAAAEPWNDFLKKEVSEIQFTEAAFRINQEATQILEGQRVEVDRYISLVYQMADQFRQRITDRESADEKIHRFNHFFFHEMGFTPDPTPDADRLVSNILLHHVLESKRGVCLSLAMIYMQMADRVGIPLSGVSVPLHFFVRHTADTTSFNIELLDGGRTDLSDDFYRKKYFVEEWEPFYMKSLNAKEVLAVFAANIASIMTQQSMAEKAVQWLEPLQQVLTEDVEVKTSLGNAYSMTGNQDKAVEWWRVAVQHNKRDDKAHYNLAQAFHQMKRYQEAIDHYDQALLLGHEVDYPLLRALERHREDSYYKSEETIKDNAVEHET